MEDKNILELYLARNERAIEETSGKYSRYCGRIAHNILASAQDTEECLNDTWLKAWATIPPQQPSCLRVYLGVLVRNLALNRYNHHHAQKRYQPMEVMLSELDECIPGKDHIQSYLNGQQIGQLLDIWLDSLESEDRRLFVRRYWYGEPVKTLAAERGCTANALSSRLKRLRGQLKRYLEQEGVTV